MDDEYVERQPGDMEAYRRIDAYAHVRLSPNAASMARIRAALVAEATLRATSDLEDVVGHDAMAVAVLPARTTSLPRRILSRAAAGLLAASLTLGMLAGTVAASSAGGPLYEQRLWLEEITLPASGTARGEAQAARLDARLAEVRGALARGDAGATAAALTAYTTILADVEVEVASDPAMATAVVDDVSRHRVVLVALVGHVPEQAQDALQHALDRSDAAVDHIGGPGSDNGADPDPGSGRPANPGANSNGNGNGDDKTEAPAASKAPNGPAKTPPAAQPAPPTPKPSKPPKPDPTPRSTPAETVEPTPTDTPARTPPAANPPGKTDRTPPPRADRPAQPDRTPRSDVDGRGAPTGGPKGPS